MRIEDLRFVRLTEWSSYFLLTSLAWKVTQSVPSVCSVCLSVHLFSVYLLNRMTFDLVLLHMYGWWQWLTWDWRSECIAVAMTSSEGGYSFWTGLSVRFDLRVVRRCARSASATEYKLVCRQVEYSPHEKKLLNELFFPERFQIWLKI